MFSTQLIFWLTFKGKISPALVALSQMVGVLSRQRNFNLFTNMTLFNSMLVILFVVLFAAILAFPQTVRHGEFRPYLQHVKSRDDINNAIRGLKWRVFNL